MRRRSGGHPTHFAVGLDLVVGGVPAAYRFEVGAVRGGGFRVAREQCRVGDARYEVRDGRLLLASEPAMPPPSPDRLYLVVASGLPAFRPLYDALSRMGFYNVQPERIRALQAPDEKDLPDAPCYHFFNGDPINDHHPTFAEKQVVRNKN